MKDQTDYLNSISYLAAMLNYTVSFEYQQEVRNLVENNLIKLLDLIPEIYKISQITQKFKLYLNSHTLQYISKIFYS